MMTIDTTNMCSHLQKKLIEEDGIYHPLWMAELKEHYQAVSEPFNGDKRYIHENGEQAFAEDMTKRGEQTMRK